MLTTVLVVRSTGGQQLNEPEPLLLSVSGAAKLLGVSRGSIELLLASGQLPWIRFSAAGDRRIPTWCVRQFVETGEPVYLKPSAA